MGKTHSLEREIEISKIAVKGLERLAEGYKNGVQAQKSLENAKKTLGYLEELLAYRKAYELLKREVKEVWNNEQLLNHLLLYQPKRSDEPEVQQEQTNEDIER